MNTLDVHLPSKEVDMPSNPSTMEPTAVGIRLESTRRLIVLIPADANHSALTHRVWELANANGIQVLLLGLCRDAAQESTLRRELITMAALMQGGGVCAEVRVGIGTNWWEVVKRNYQTGDMLVCLEEQRTGFLYKPLSQILHARLNAPVYILSGSFSQNVPQINWLPPSLAWTGSFGIIAGGALLQIRITSLSQDWVQTLLLILSVIGEIWLLWGWNSLFS